MVADMERGGKLAGVRETTVDGRMVARLYAYQGPEESVEVVALACVTPCVLVEGESKRGDAGHALWREWKTIGDDGVDVVRVQLSCKEHGQRVFAMLIPEWACKDAGARRALAVAAIAESCGVKTATEEGLRDVQLLCPKGAHGVLVVLPGTQSPANRDVQKPGCR